MITFTVLKPLENLYSIVCKLESSSPSFIFFLVKFVPFIMAKQYQHFDWCSHLSFPLSSFIFVSRGENKGSQTQEVQEQVNVLKAHLSELDAQEKELDNQKAWLEENIKHLNHDPVTSIYPFECLRFNFYSGLRFCVMSLFFTSQS